MENVDTRLFDIDYKNADNIAYITTMLEFVWGVDRISTIMNSARIILDRQEQENLNA